jgi:hypothetical protein
MCKLCARQLKVYRRRANDGRALKKKTVERLIENAALPKGRRRRKRRALCTLLARVACISAAAAMLREFFLSFFAFPSRERFRTELDGFDTTSKTVDTFSSSNELAKAVFVQRKEYVEHRTAFED